MFAQQREVPDDFNFWVGEWEVHWLNADSSYTYGSNSITWVLDSTCIQENFHDPNSGFKGRSLSVYAAKDSSWHQSWVDNAGGYFDFYGIIEGDRKIFQTKEEMRDGKPFVQRMVFHSIKKDSFIWDWEASGDGGKNWNLQWQIFYERKVQE